MDGTLRGKGAIIGIGELQPLRRRHDRTGIGLAAEAAVEAIADAGLLKEDIDGLLTELAQGEPAALAEYLGIRPSYANGMNMFGATGAAMFALATMVVNSGMAKNVLCVINTAAGDALDGGFPRNPYQVNYEVPWGPGVAQNSNYAMIAQRHMFEFGTTEEQLAKIAVDQRFNAQANRMAAFYGTPLELSDVMNSRYVSDPLKLLECVMPTTGAAAMVVTSADRANSGPNKPVYLLGAGISIEHGIPPAHAIKMVNTPVQLSARAAFQMAKLAPRDMDMLSLYDCYTITVAVSLEDAGFCKKGEAGDFITSHDFTYKGDLPLNTHGGQLSFGQSGLAGGFSHVIESARQMMGRGEDRQVEDLDFCFVNG